MKIIGQDERLDFLEAYRPGEALGRGLVMLTLSFVGPDPKPTPQAIHSSA